eukprot:gene8383-6908_t
MAARRRAAKEAKSQKAARRWQLEALRGLGAGRGPPN